MKNKKDSVIKIFGHIIALNYKLCKWILPCNILKNVLQAAVPYVGIVYGCRILDGLINKMPTKDILSMVYQFAVITMVLLLLSFAGDRVGNTLRDNIRYRIQNDVANKAVSLDYQDLEKQETMQLLAAALEGEAESGGVYWFSDRLGTLVGDIASVVYAFIVMFPLLLLKQTSGNTILQTVFSSQILMYVMFALNLGSMFIFMWISKKGNDRQYKLYEESLDLVRKDEYFYREVLKKYTVGKEIRLYNMQEFLLDDMHKVWNEKCDIERKRIGVSRKIRMQSFAVQAVLLLFSYLIIGTKGIMGLITAAEVVKYVSALTALGGACQFMVEHYEDVLLNMKYLHRYYEYLHLPNRKETGDKNAMEAAEQKFEITFENVSFQYEGNPVYSVNNVNLTIHSGEKIALVGPNGAGKTTLILLLCRLYEPTEGRILLNGIDIREYDYQSYRDIFGVVFQDFKLFSMDVGQNVAASEKYDSKQVWEALKKAGIKERIEKMEKGLDTQLYNLEDKGVEISGGEAQKIAIARALYKNSPFIILDEPTSALDPVSEYEIYSGFNELVTNKTAVYISHRMSSCRFCDRIIVLDKGAIEEDGSHEELISKKGLYSELWNSQAQYYK